MYPDSGPSRSGSSYGPSKAPGREQGSTPRQGSGRYEQEYEGDRGYGRPQETPNRPFPNSSPWSRPNSRPGFRPYPNGPPRARTPSPPRARTPSPPRQTSEWDRRDVRPRERARSRERERPLDDRDIHRAPISNFNIPDRRAGGYVPPPRERDLPPHVRDRRGPRDERFPIDETRSQSFSPTKQPWSRDRPNPSPPKSLRSERALGPWNGTPRVNSNPRILFQLPRERDDRPERTPFRSRNSSGEISRSGQGGPGPASSAYQASTRSSPGGTPPRATRSVRGNSSPVETRHRAEAVPVEESVPPPKVKVEVEEGELEEGEVMSSPARPDIELPRHADFVPSVQPRDRWREWPDDRTRPREPFDRVRERRWHAGPARSPDRGASREPLTQAQPWMVGQSVDDGWGQKRKVEDGPARNVEQEEVKEEDGRYDEEEVKAEDAAEPEEDDRPATPPLPSPPRRPPVEVTADDERTEVPPRPPSPAEANIPITRLPSPPQPSLPSPISLPTLDAVTSSAKADNDVARPETPALPSAGITQQAEAARAQQPPLPVEAQSPPAAPKPRTTEATIAAYVPRQPQAIPQPAITAQQPTPAVDIPPEGSAAPNITSPTSPADERKPSTNAAASVTLPSAPLPPVLTETELPTAAQAADEDVQMGEEIKLKPPTPTPPPVEASIAPPTPRPAFSPLLTAGPHSPVARQPTLAERRAVKLPTTQGPLSSPFGGRTPLRDPAPTNISQQDSTDSEVWPRTADMEDAQSADSDEDPETTREMRLVSAIKQAQKVKASFDVDAIVAWNLAAAPPESARVTKLSPRKREKKLKEASSTMGRQEKAVAKLVAQQIAKEHERTLERTANLRKEYLALDEEWREHCAFLDDLMEKRGPPPESLYAIPNAVPVVVPGPAPMTPTPLAEDVLSSRAIRRRGAGDAVTTEAEFQEILAAMADTAAKDPNYRASKTTAAVPDMLPPTERKLRFEDDNDLVEDPIAFYDFRGNAEPIWTEEERQIFLRRYLNFPKQFGKIAEPIPNKSASDCVLYYYRTKKEVDYKSMLASRRGVSKRKTIPLKKGGKSAALLASLDQKKETVKARALPTPSRLREDMLAPPLPTSVARRGGKPRMDTGSRRKVIDVQTEDAAAEEAVSRDASEAPSATKVKRVTMKGPKRPRISSVAGPATPGGTTPAAQVDENGTPIPQSELLPPVKRAKKAPRTKTAAIDFAEPTLDGVAEAVSTPGSANGVVRRGNTSSYWNVDEKKRLKELVGVHQRDLRAIAAGLPGKSERQIFNFCEAHAEELGLEPGAYASEIAVTPGIDSPFTKEEYFKSAVNVTEGRSRSIYDVYSQHTGPFGQHEPRLGVFPSLPRSNPVGIATPAAPLPPRASPTQQVARSGGMRISALLNDEPLPSPVALTDRRDNADAQSDGTVEDRDEAFRPPSRDTLPPSQRRESHGMDQVRPNMGEYRRPSHVGYMYQPPPPSAAWQQQPQQRRPNEAYYTRASPPRPTMHPPPTHSRSSDPAPTRSSHAYYPASDPPHPPHPQHQQLPHRTMEYYRSRPDVYRSQTSNSDPYAPSYAQTSGQGYAPPDVGRYDHNHPQDWRSYRRTPPPGLPAQGQGHTVSAPAGRAGPGGAQGQGWYDDQRRVVLPGIRSVYDEDDGRGR